MIIEGLLTTTSADGSPHIAPMGPVVDEALNQWRLRPFQSSTTCANLLRHGVCVFHVMDDVLPVVQSALSLPVDLQCQPLAGGGWMISASCHWYLLETGAWDLSQPRATVDARVVDSGVRRPFWGWNRAKHAILEATILATRLHLTGTVAIREELVRLEIIVQKTAGQRERDAWNLVAGYIQTWNPGSAPNSAESR